jgi:low temperature requirement protein LtrA
MAQRSRFATPMVARSRTEPHRASTPLELLFDLSFVVAVAQAAATLHHEVLEGHTASGVLGYALVFFAIWWAWMNFTWFASAYDTDDVPYRLLTFVQIAGVLILAAGVPAAVVDRDFATVTYGYVVMRVALVAQWLRVAAQYPPGRGHALRYAAGIATLQLGWLARLLLPEDLALPSFLLLAAAELAVPLWAEHELRQPIPWHPDHIAERYGLFTIIVIGESILAATVAMQEAITERGVSGSLLLVSASGLALIFGLWWTYFDRPAVAGLRTSPRGVFRWGYGHLVVFASLAAVGAGLQVAAETTGHESPVAERTAALTVGIPVAVYLVAAGVLHTWINRYRHERLITPFTLAAALVAVAAAATPPLSLPVSVAAMASLVAGLLAYDLVTRPVQP